MTGPRKMRSRSGVVNGNLRLTSSYLCRYRAAMRFHREDTRFEGDVLPDGTWGICRLHSPGGVVRLVDDDGRPAIEGICVHCWEESKDDAYFTCPVHGLQPKAPGSDGCPVGDCMGTGDGPTEDEIARETESNCRIWPGGAPVREDVLAQKEPGPPVERGGEVVASPQGEAERVLPDDGAGVEDRFSWRDTVVGDGWRDRFLDP